MVRNLKVTFLMHVTLKLLKNDAGQDKPTDYDSLSGTHYDGRLTRSGWSLDWEGRLEET
jgi:hypothetical protein